MARYIYLYKGPNVEMSPDFGAAWGAWMQKVGSALLDEGAPFGQGTNISDDHKESAASNFTGFTIMEATDLNHAKALMDCHPWLAGSDGTFSFDIFELIAM